MSNNKIWLSHPEQFNDPFDSQFKISSEKNEEILKIISALLHGENDTYEHGLRNYLGTRTDPDDPDTAVAPPFTEVIYYALRSNRINYKDLISHLRNSKIDSHELEKFCSTYEAIGICSFSQNFYDPQMWAYYSDNHKGICIEYELSPLPAELKLQHVHYDLSATETIKPTTQIKEEDLLKQIYHKSNVWKHENEIRLISNKQTKRLIQFPGKITGICFGIQTPKHEQDIWHDLLTAKQNLKEEDFFKGKLNDSYMKVDWKGDLFEERTYHDYV